jgi:hypothetical protein
MLRRDPHGWRLFTGPDEHPGARVTLDQSSAWKLLSKGLSPEAARRGVTIEGNRALGEPMFSALAVMA